MASPPDSINLTDIISYFCRLTINCAFKLGCAIDITIFFLNLFISVLSIIYNAKARVFQEVVTEYGNVKTDVFKLYFKNIFIRWRI